MALSWSSLLMKMLDFEVPIFFCFFKYLFANVCPSEFLCVCLPACFSINLVVYKVLYVFSFGYIHRQIGMLKNEFYQNNRFRYGSWTSAYNPELLILKSWIVWSFLCEAERYFSKNFLAVLLYFLSMYVVLYLKTLICTIIRKYVK